MWVCDRALSTSSSSSSSSSYYYFSSSYSSSSSSSVLSLILASLSLYLDLLSLSLCLRLLSVLLSLSVWVGWASPPLVVGEQISLRWLLSCDRRQDARDQQRDRIPTREVWQSCAGIAWCESSKWLTENEQFRDRMLSQQSLLLFWKMPTVSNFCDRARLWHPCLYLEQMLSAAILHRSIVC